MMRPDLRARIAGSTVRVIVSSPGTAHRARVGHIQADSLDVRRGGGQGGERFLPACRREDEMPPPGELDRRGPSDSRACTGHEHVKLACHVVSQVVHGRGHVPASEPASREETDRQFGSKDQLVAQSLDAHGEDILGMYIPAAGDDALPRQQILAVFDGLRRWAATDEFRGCPFINAATELADPGHPARRVARDYFARQAERGSAEDPQRLADQLIVVFDGAMVQAVMGTGLHTDAARTAVQALLDAQRIP